MKLSKGAFLDLGSYIPTLIMIGGNVRVVHITVHTVDGVWEEARAVQVFHVLQIIQMMRKHG